MTIHFYGHVEAVSAAAMPGMIAVQVNTPGASCKDHIVLFVPKSAAAHWLVGRSVQVSAYAFDPTPADPQP